MYVILRPQEPAAWSEIEKISINTLLYFLAKLFDNIFINPKILDSFRTTFEWYNMYTKLQKTNHYIV